MLRHRDMVNAAEIARLAGEPTWSPAEIHAELEAMYAAAEIS